MVTMVSMVPAISERAAPLHSSTGEEAGEGRLVAALRDGDETAFMALVERYHSLLIRLALPYVGAPAVAEEVAQETWLEVVRGVHRFEGRSALKTWLCAILLNLARRRATREARSVPFSALEQSADASDGSDVAPQCFDEAGWWASAAQAPRPWPLSPEEHALSGEARACLAAAIATLPPQQRQVIVLRDVQGWPAAEVCDALGLSEANQRVLLHRARSRARGALDSYYTQGRGPGERPTRS
jgi:RNA polymerase sigma-70 factor (ECF subfamily)